MRSDPLLICVTLSFFHSGPAHHTPCQTPPPPPPDIQPIIDKMANYVARNGLEFEVTVRNKNDPRFEFLQDWHTHHAYYLMKKNQIKKVGAV